LQDFNRPLDSAPILFADMDQFSAGDGKQLFANSKRAFDNGLKSGANIDDNALVPQAKDDLEKKKYAVIEAQKDLKRENAANQDDEVKKPQKALSDSGASSTNDSIYIERRWLTWKRRSTTLAQNGPGLMRAKRR
jgi:hypothetical protein